MSKNKLSHRLDAIANAKERKIESSYDSSYHPTAPVAENPLFGDSYREPGEESPTFAQANRESFFSPEVRIDEVDDQMLTRQSDLVLRRAEEQSTARQIFNATIPRVISGGLEMGELLTSLPGSVAGIVGGEEAAKDWNKLSHALADARRDWNEIFPIYVPHNDNWSWEGLWMGVGSLVESLTGFIGAGGVTTKIAGAMGERLLARYIAKSVSVGGMKNLSKRELAKLIMAGADDKLAEALAKGAKFNSLGMKIASEGIPLVANSLMMNEMEGNLMAYDIYKQNREASWDKWKAGKSDLSLKEIDERAVEAGNRFKRFNRAMILQNMFEMGGLTKALGASRQMLKPNYRTAFRKSLTASGHDNLFLQGLFEGAEEVYQSGFEKTLSDPDRSQDSWSDVVKKSLENMQTADAAFEGILGFVGGVGQKTGLEATGNKAAKKRHDIRYLQQEAAMEKAQEYMDLRMKTSANMHDMAESELLDAHGDFTKASVSLESSWVETVAENMAVGSTEMLIDELNKYIGMTAETAESLGVKAEDVDNIVEGAKSMMTTLLDMENYFVRDASYGRFVNPAEMAYAYGIMRSITKAGLALHPENEQLQIRAQEKAAQIAKEWELRGHDFKNHLPDTRQKDQPNPFEEGSTEAKAWDTFNAEVRASREFEAGVEGHAQIAKLGDAAQDVQFKLTKMRGKDWQAKKKKKIEEEAEELKRKIDEAHKKIKAKEKAEGIEKRAKKKETKEKEKEAGSRNWKFWEKKTKEEKPGEEKPEEEKPEDGKVDISDKVPQAGGSGISKDLDGDVEPEVGVGETSGQAAEKKAAEFLRRQTGIFDDEFIPDQEDQETEPEGPVPDPPPSQDPNDPLREIPAADLVVDENAETQLEAFLRELAKDDPRLAELADDVRKNIEEINDRIGFDVFHSHPQYQEIRRLVLGLKALYDSQRRPAPKPAAASGIDIIKLFAAYVRDISGALSRSVGAYVVSGNHIVFTKPEDMSVEQFSAIMNELPKTKGIVVGEYDPATGVIKVLIQPHTVDGTAFRPAADEVETLLSIVDRVPHTLWGVQPESASQEDQKLLDEYEQQLRKLEDEHNARMKAGEFTGPALDPLTDLINEIKRRIKSLASGFKDRIDPNNRTNQISDRLDQIERDLKGGYTSAEADQLNDEDFEAWQDSPAFGGALLSVGETQALIDEQDSLYLELDERTKLGDFGRQDSRWSKHGKASSQRYIDLKNAAKREAQKATEFNEETHVELFINPGESIILEREGPVGPLIVYDKTNSKGVREVIYGERVVKSTGQKTVILSNSGGVAIPISDVYQGETNRTWNAFIASDSGYKIQIISAKIYPDGKIVATVWYTSDKSPGGKIEVELDRLPALKATEVTKEKLPLPSQTFGERLDSATQGILQELSALVGNDNVQRIITATSEEELNSAVADLYQSLMFFEGDPAAGVAGLNKLKSIQDSLRWTEVTEEKLPLPSEEDNRWQSGALKDAYELGRQSVLKGISGSTGYLPGLDLDKAFKQGRKDAKAEIEAEKNGGISPNYTLESVAAEIKAIEKQAKTGAITRDEASALLNPLYTIQADLYTAEKEAKRPPETPPPPAPPDAPTDPDEGGPDNEGPNLPPTGVITSADVADRKETTDDDNASRRDGPMPDLIAKGEGSELEADNEAIIKAQESGENKFMSGIVSSRFPNLVTLAQKIVNGVKGFGYKASESISRGLPNRFGDQMFPVVIPAKPFMAAGEDSDRAFPAIVELFKTRSKVVWSTEREVWLIEGTNTEIEPEHINLEGILENGEHFYLLAPDSIRNANSNQEEIDLLIASAARMKAGLWNALVQFDGRTDRVVRIKGQFRNGGRNSFIGYEEGAPGRPFREFAKRLGLTLNNVQVGVLGMKNDARNIGTMDQPELYKSEEAMDVWLKDKKGSKTSKRALGTVWLIVNSPQGVFPIYMRQRMVDEREATTIYDLILQGMKGKAYDILKEGEVEGVEGLSVRAALDLLIEHSYPREQRGHSDTARTVYPRFKEGVVEIGDDNYTIEKFIAAKKKIIADLQKVKARNVDALLIGEGRTFSSMNQEEFNENFTFMGESLSKNGSYKAWVLEGTASTPPALTANLNLNHTDGNGRVIEGRENAFWQPGISLGTEDDIDVIAVEQPVAETPSAPEPETTVTPTVPVLSNPKPEAKPNDTTDQVVPNSKAANFIVAWDNFFEELDKNFHVRPEEQQNLDIIQQALEDGKYDLNTIVTVMRDHIFSALEEGMGGAIYLNDEFNGAAERKLKKHLDEIVEAAEGLSVGDIVIDQGDASVTVSATERVDAALDKVEQKGESVTPNVTVSKNTEGVPPEKPTHPAQTETKIETTPFVNEATEEIERLMKAFAAENGMEITSTIYALRHVRFGVRYTEKKGITLLEVIEGKFIIYYSAIHGTIGKIEGAGNAEQRKKTAPMYGKLQALSGTKIAEPRTRPKTETGHEILGMREIKGHERWKIKLADGREVKMLGDTMSASVENQEPAEFKVLDEEGNEAWLPVSDLEGAVILLPKTEDKKVEASEVKSEEKPFDVVAEQMSEPITQDVLDLFKGFDSNNAAEAFDQLGRAIQSFSAGRDNIVAVIKLLALASNLRYKAQKEASGEEYKSSLDIATTAREALDSAKELLGWMEFWEIQGGNSIYKDQEGIKKKLFSLVGQLEKSVLGKTDLSTDEITLEITEKKTAVETPAVEGEQTVKAEPEVDTGVKQPGWRGVPEDPGLDPRFEGFTIISGGQEGADRAALHIARKWGIKTGGWAPSGWITKLTTKLNNWAKDLTLKEFGLIEDDAVPKYGTKNVDKYNSRTRRNVEDSDMTIWFGYTTEKKPGGGLYSYGWVPTKKAIDEFGKPYLINPSAKEIADAIRAHGITSLNVAGNRDGSGGNPKVWSDTTERLDAAFQRLADDLDETAEMTRYDDLKDIPPDIEKGEYDPEAAHLRSNGHPLKEKVIEALKKIGTTDNIEHAALLLEDGTMIESPNAKFVTDGELNLQELMTRWHMSLIEALMEAVPEWYVADPPPSAQAEVDRLNAELGIPRLADEYSYRSDDGAKRKYNYGKAIKLLLNTTGGTRVHYLGAGFTGAELSISFIASMTQAQIRQVTRMSKEIMDMSAGYGFTFSGDVLDIEGNNAGSWQRRDVVSMREIRTAIQGYAAPTDASYLRAHPFESKFANLLVDLLAEYGIALNKLSGREVKELFKNEFNPDEMLKLATRVGHISDINQIPRDIVPLIGLIVSQHQDVAFWEALERTPEYKARDKGRAVQLQIRGYSPDRHIMKVRRGLIEQYFANEIDYELKKEYLPLREKILLYTNKLFYGLNSPMSTGFNKKMQELFQAFLGRGISIEPKKGFIQVDPAAVIDADPTVTKVLNSGLFSPFGHWALSGSLALATEGKIFRDPSDPIHDLDIVLLEYMSIAELREEFQKVFPDDEVEAFLGLAQSERPWGTPGSQAGVTVKTKTRTLLLDIFFINPRVKNTKFIKLATTPPMTVQVTSQESIFAPKLTFARSKDFLDFAQYRKTDYLSGAKWEPGYNREKARRWLMRVLPNTPVEFINEILDNIGEQAFGVFRDGIIGIADYATLGTEFHEAFHAVFRTYLSAESRAALYREAQAMRPDLKSAIELEEFLAEEFRMFMVGRREEYGLASYPPGILGFFKRIWAWVKGVRFRENGVVDLFNKIDSGGFAQDSPFETEGYTPAFLMKIGKMNHTESDQFVQYMVAKLVYWSGLDSESKEDGVIARSRSVTADTLKNALTDKSFEQALNIASAHGDKLIADGDPQLGIEFKRLLIDTELMEKVKAEVMDEIKSWGIRVKFKPDRPALNKEIEGKEADKQTELEGTTPENVGIKKSSQEVKNFDSLPDPTRLAVKFATHGLFAGTEVNGKWEPEVVGPYQIPKIVDHREAWGKLEMLLSETLEEDGTIEIEAAEIKLKKQGKTDPVIKFLYSNVWSLMNDTAKRSFMQAFMVANNNYQTTEVSSRFVGIKIVDEVNDTTKWRNRWSGTNSYTYNTSSRLGLSQSREEWTANMQMDKLWNNIETLQKFIDGFSLLAMNIDRTLDTSNAMRDATYVQYREELIKVFGWLNLPIDEATLDQLFIAKGSRKHEVQDLRDFIAEFNEEHVRSAKEQSGTYTPGTISYLLDLAMREEKGDKAAIRLLTRKSGEDTRIFSLPPGRNGANIFSSRSFAEQLLPAYTYTHKKIVGGMVLVEGNKTLWKFTKWKEIQKFFGELKSGLNMQKDSSRMNDITSDRFANKWVTWLPGWKILNGKSEGLKRVEVQYIAEMRNMDAKKNKGKQIQNVDLASKTRMFLGWALEGVDGTKEQYRGPSRWVWSNPSDKNELAILVGPSPIRVWKRHKYSAQERVAAGQVVSGIGFQGLFVDDFLFHEETITDIKDKVVAELGRMYDVWAILDNENTKWWELEVGMFGSRGTLAEIAEREELTRKDRLKLMSESQGMSAAVFGRFAPDQLFETDRDLFDALFEKVSVKQEDGPALVFYKPLLKSEPDIEILNALEPFIVETLRDGLRTDMESLVHNGLADKGDLDGRTYYYYDEAKDLAGVFSERLQNVYRGMLNKYLPGNPNIPGPSSQNNMLQMVMTAEASINSIISHLNQLVLVHGDLAYYNGHEDLAKRIAMSNTDGVYMMPTPETKLSRKKHFRVSIFSDVEYKSTNFTNPRFESIVEKGLIVTGIDKEIARRRAKSFAKAYGKVNVADAQAWITPERWKNIQEETGRFNPTAEKAYDKMMAGEALNVYEAEIIMSPIKGEANGVIPGGKLGRRPIYLKYSMAVITPGMSEASPALNRLWNKEGTGYMQTNEIDEMIMESGIKLGAKGVENLSRAINGEANPNATIDLPKSIWKIQVETPNKGAYMRRFGTQQRANFLSGILDSMQFSFNNEKWSGASITKHYNMLYAAISDRSIARLKDRYGHNRKTNKFTRMDKVVEDMTLKIENEGKSPRQLVDLLGVTPEGRLTNHPGSFPGAEKGMNQFFSILNRGAIGGTLFGGSGTQVSALLSTSVREISIKGSSAFSESEQAELESTFGPLAPPQLFVKSRSGRRPVTVSNKQIDLLNSGRTIVSLRNQKEKQEEGIFIAEDQKKRTRLVAVKYIGVHTYKGIAASTLHRLAVSQGYEGSEEMLADGRGEIKEWMLLNREFLYEYSYTPLTESSESLDPTKILENYKISAPESVTSIGRAGGIGEEVSIEEADALYYVTSESNLGDQPVLKGVEADRILASAAKGIPLFVYSEESKSWWLKTGDTWAREVDQPDLAPKSYMRSSSVLGEPILRDLMNQAVARATEVNQDIVVFSAGDILLPNYMKSFLPRELQDPIKLTAFIMDNPEMFNLIAHRIPGQARYSLDAVRVKGFLPPEMGDSVIMYDEITKKNGSDFDIDKLFLILPSISKRRKRNAAGEFLTDEGGRQLWDFYAERYDRRSSYKDEFTPEENQVSEMRITPLESANIESGQKTTMALSDARHATFSKEQEEGKPIYLKVEDNYFKATLRGKKNVTDAGGADAMMQSEGYSSLERGVPGGPETKTLDKFFKGENELWVWDLAPVEREISKAARDRWRHYVRNYLRTNNDTLTREKSRELDESDTLSKSDVLMGNWARASKAGKNEWAGIEIPSLVEFANWPIPRQNTEGAIGNEIIAIHHAVNANIGIYAQLVTPIDVMVNEMKAYVEEVKKITKDGEIDTFSTFTTAWQVKLDSLFKAAKDLVGSLANHVKAHSLLERSGISLGEDSIGEVTDLPNEYMITEVLSGLLSGAVDVTKGAWIAYLGLNQTTAAAAAYMLRTRVPWRKVFAMLKQPIMEDYVRLKNQYDSPFVRRKRGTQDDLEQELEDLYPIKVEGDEAPKTVRIPDDYDGLLKLLTAERTSDWNRLQRKIFSEFLVADEQGIILQSIYTTMKVDVDGAGRDSSDLKATIDQAGTLAAREILEIPPLLVGYNKFMQNNETIASHWKNAIFFIQGVLIANKIDITFSPRWSSIETELLELAGEEEAGQGYGISMTNAEHIREMTRAIYQWLYISLVNQKSKTLRAGWFHEGKEQLAARVRAAQEDPSLVDNTFIQGLTWNWHEESELMFVSLKETDKEAKYISDAIDDFNKLWTEQEDLAKALAYYAIVTTGGNGRKGSFFDIIITSQPLRDHLAINDFFESFWDEKELFEGDPIHIAEQIIMHNANSNRFVKSVWMSNDIRNAMRYGINENPNSPRLMVFDTATAYKLGLVKGAMTSALNPGLMTTTVIPVPFVRVDNTDGSSSLYVAVKSDLQKGMIFAPVKTLGYFERGERIYDYLPKEDSINYIPPIAERGLTGSRDFDLSTLGLIVAPDRQVVEDLVNETTARMKRIPHAGLVEEVAEQKKKCDI